MINLNELNEFIANGVDVPKGMRPEQALSSFLMGLWKHNVSDIVVASAGGHRFYSKVFDHMAQACDKLLATRPDARTDGRLQTLDGKSLRFQGTRMNHIECRGFSFDVMVMYMCELSDMNAGMFYEVLLPMLEIENTMLLSVWITEFVEGEGRRLVARRITMDEVLKSK